MDYRVGQILDAIKEAGIDDNTIVILSSDNGGGGAIPQLGGSTNGPWRGDFFNTPFEGSMRVPAMIRWPGKVPAGVVTKRYSPLWTGCPRWPGWWVHRNSCPRIDPSTASTLRPSCWARAIRPAATATCSSASDGELMSIKWKIYKTVFRYTDNTLTPAIQNPYIKPQFPMFYDLSSDPHEDNNLFYTDLTNGWMLAPDFKIIGEYERSVKEYPNIKVGRGLQGL